MLDQSTTLTSTSNHSKSMTYYFKPFYQNSDMSMIRSKILRRWLFAR